MHFFYKAGKANKNVATNMTVVKKLWTWFLIELQYKLTWIWQYCAFADSNSFTGMPHTALHLKQEPFVRKANLPWHSLSFVFFGHIHLYEVHSKGHATQ